MLILYAFFITILATILEARLGLYEVTLSNEDQLKGFTELASKLKLDLWTHPSLTNPARFSTNSDPEHIKYIKSHLVELNLQLRIVNENLDETIDKVSKDNAVIRARAQFKSANGGGIETYFGTHNDYNSWLHSMANENPNLVTVIDIGKSFHGKQIKAVKLSTGPKKESMLMEAGIHAREWLGVSSLVWILNKIVTGYRNKEAEAKQILDRFDVYVIPVMNPDGYEHTRRGGRLRMWRKNLMPSGRGCEGVDLNRNFDVDFGRIGVSWNPCEEIYPGAQPFSAPETQAFRDFVYKIKANLKLFISFHAYSQLLLTPWGYTKTPPSDNAELMRVANLMVNEIYKTSGLRYQAGSPAHILYEASGGCDDWMKQIGIKYSYTFEVRPDMHHPAGFVAPPEWIVPNGVELYRSLLVAVKAVQ